MGKLEARGSENKRAPSRVVSSQNVILHSFYLTSNPADVADDGQALGETISVNFENRNLTIGKDWGRGDARAEQRGKRSPDRL